MWPTKTSTLLMWPGLPKTMDTPALNLLTDINHAITNACISMHLCTKTMQNIHYNLHFKV